MGATDYAEPHILGRTPNGYIMFRSYSGGTLYDASTGTTTWTNTNIALRASIAGTYDFLVF
jgi:hypothetical protein